MNTLTLRDLALLGQGQITVPPPVAWWEADSFSLADNTRILESGRVWVDSSGNGNTGTNGGVAARNPTYRTNQVNGHPAMIPDNDGSDAVIMTNTIDLGVNNWTLVSVFGATVPASSGVGLMGGPGPNHIAVYYADAGPQRLHFRSSLGSSDDSISLNLDTTAGNLLMATLRLTAGSADWFENLTNKTSAAGRPHTNGGSYILAGFMTDFNTYPFWFGKFCLAQVYNVALTNAQIAALYNAYVKPKYGLP